MINRKAIGYITANYSTREKSVLLEDRPFASLPFGGRYRLIDFPLSNMMNAGIKSVAVVMPGNYRSLIDHMGSGKDWTLDRKTGGLFLVPGNPFGTTRSGMRFLLRDIIANKIFFQRSDAPYVVMCGSNVIFNMDLNKIIDAHEASGARVTMVYRKATRKSQDAATLTIGDRGRVTDITTGCEYGDNKFLDCAVINRQLLLDIVEAYSSADYLDLFEAVKDVFHRIDVCSYEFKGLTMGIVDEETYYKRSMDLLNPDIQDQLFDPDRPIITKAHDVPPARYASGSSARNALISAGCQIQGTVRSSILSRGVTVEPGASVTNSIIMQGCVVKSGARVENAIIDKNNVIAANTEYRGTPDSILVMRKAPFEA